MMDIGVKHHFQQKFCYIKAFSFYCCQNLREKHWPVSSHWHTVWYNVVQGAFPYEQDLNSAL